MDDLLLHMCCGPCATVAVPAWRKRGIEPLGWFHNPNVQPVAELERRLESACRYAGESGVELITDASTGQAEAWRDWTAALATTAPEERCRDCLTLRLHGVAAAAARMGIPRFSTTLSVSPYQRHDLIVDAGESAAREHGADFVYLDLRERFRESHSESRRLGLYRQSYCGCVASKWESWEERRRRRRAG